MNDRIHARFRHKQGDFILDTELDIPARGITGLYGPSGSGKSTLLRCIAGLDQPKSGFLCMDGNIWQDSDTWIPAHLRPIGMVFQDIRLFPHKSVKDNLLYGYKRRSASQAGIDLKSITELLQLDDFMMRKPSSLSGGEAQRVAIGRALMSAPKLLLMDEPLAAVDAAGKHEFISFLNRLHRQMDIPIIMVSHHMQELVQVADHLTLIEQGRILACGPIAKVLSMPDLSQTHAFETGALLEGAIHAFDPHYCLTRLHSDAGELIIPGRIGENGDHIRIRIHARDISLSLTPPTDSSVLNVLPVMITGMGLAKGPLVDVRLEANSTPLLAKLTRKSCDQLQLKPGHTVFAQIKSVAIEQ